MYEKNDMKNLGRPYNLFLICACLFSIFSLVEIALIKTNLLLVEKTPLIKTKLKKYILNSQVLIPRLFYVNVN